MLIVMQLDAWFYFLMPHQEVGIIKFLINLDKDSKGRRGNRLTIRCRHEFARA